MLNPGGLAAYEAVLRSLGADSPKDKHQILDITRRIIGLNEEPAQASSLAATDVLLSIREAAARLSKTPRTVQYLVATRQLTGHHTGRSGKLCGIPASAITAYISAGSAPRTRQEAVPA